MDTIVRQTSHHAYADLNDMVLFKVVVEECPMLYMWHDLSEGDQIQNDGKEVSGH